MTTPPTIQTNPLDPVFSGVPVVFPQEGLVNPTWNKWFVDLREKVNVINSTLAAWSGITPVTGLTPGTYGDITHYPIITVNEFGLVTVIATQSISGGGGAPMHINTVTTDYTVAASDIPSASSYIGMIITNSSASNLITLDLMANTEIPVGATLYVMQSGAGETQITGVTGTSIYGASITGAGQYALGKAMQTSNDTWYISGDIAFIPSGGDPYWADVASLLHFEGANGGTVFNDQIARTWTPNVATTSTTQYKFGTSSGHFPGSSNISAADSSGTSFLNFAASDYTIEGWIYPTVVSGYQDIVAKRANGGVYAAFYLRISSGKLQCGTSSGSTWYQSPTSSSSITPNTWTYVAMVRHGTTITQYINGVADGVITIPSSITFSSTTLASPVSIGALGDLTEYFTGYIDEVRITSIARYTSNFTPPATPFPNF